MPMNVGIREHILENTFHVREDTLNVKENTFHVREQITKTNTMCFFVFEHSHYNQHNVFLCFM